MTSALHRSRMPHGSGRRRKPLLKALFPVTTLLLGSALTQPLLAMSDTPPAESPAGLAQPGPGLGNLSYSSSELFTPVSWINQDSGVPPTYAFRKAYGANVGMMVDGYFLTLFAPDSGWGPGGFLLYDVSDPRNIQLVKRIYEPEGRTGEFREAHAFGLTKINDRRYVSVQTIKGIEIWDFTDLNDPQQVSKLVLPGVNSGDYTAVAWQQWWQAPYLYVAASDQGVFIVDASDPANPVIANRGNGRPNPVPPAELGGSRVGPIFTLGNQMVVTSMDQRDGFASLDISDPLNPRLLDRTPDLPQGYYATCFDGNKVHASVRGAGAYMVSYDLSNPGKFVLESNSLQIDEQLYCGVQDNHVFQGIEHAVHKVDISNPFNYTDIGHGSLPVANADHGQVAPFGNLVFIGNDHGTGNAFMVHDIHPDTTAPWVKQVSPRPGALNQALTSRIGIAFADSVDFESISAATIQLRPVTEPGSAPLAGTYSAWLGLVNFTPAQPLAPNTEYELRVSGVKDYAGNALSSLYISRFTTGSATNASLAYHWPLDGNGRDEAGGNHGELSSGQFSEGGLALNAAGQLSLDDDVSGILGGSATVSFYLKTTQSGSNNAWQAPGLFGRDNENGTEDVFWGWLDSNGRLRLSAGNDSGISTPQAVNNGEWRHVVLSRNSADGALSIWLNGERVASGSARAGILGGAWYNSYQTLGRILQQGQALQGVIDDVRVYNRVLSDNEIQTLAATPVLSINADTREMQQQVNTAGSFRVDIRGSENALISWNFGDGTVTPFSSANPVSHQYSTPGHYRVIVTIQTPEGEQTQSFEHTVTYPLTPQAPANSTPVTGDGQQVYNVNPDNGTVTAINASSLNKVWEVAVGRDPKTLAIGPNGWIWVAVQADDLLLALDSAGQVRKRVALPYGDGPYGIVFTPDQSLGLVTLQNRGQLLSFDPYSGAELNRVAVNPDARGLAVDADSERAYVTRMRTAISNNGTGGAEISVVNLGSMTAENSILLANDTSTTDAEDRGRGVPNYLHQVVISPDGRRAWVPSTKVNIERGPVRDGRPLSHDSTVRTVVNQIDLSSGSELFAEQIDFNDRDSAHALAFSPQGDYVLVALQGSNTVEIVDAYSGAVRGALNQSGLAPQGVYIDAERQRAFIYNFTSRSVSVFDLKDVLASVSFAPAKVADIMVVANEKLEDSVLRGKQIFYNARDLRMSRDGYMACASCHIEGLDDGVVWDFTDRGEGLRNTISLKGRMGLGHGRVHWTANFDEIQDFENDIRYAFGGTGFLADADFNATQAPLGAAKAGKSTDLDALAAYVASLENYERSPYRSENGKLTAAAQSGEALFGEVGCAGCHSGDTKRDGQRHDVGTILPDSGLGQNQPLAGVGFDTPTLHGVWRTAPYFHNGQLPTLEAVLASGHGANRSLNSAEQTQLLAYVRSLDGAEKQYFRMQMRDWDECWVAEGVGDDANIGRYQCGDWNDQWWYQDLLGRFHPKRAEHYCAKGQAADGGWFSLWKCNNNADQQWQTDGYLIRLKADPGKVVDAHQGQLREVNMWSENGNNNQFWQKNPSDFRHLRHGSGLCLTAVAVQQDSGLVLSECRVDEKQQWREDSAGRFHLLANPNLCLDYKGQTQDNGALVLWACNGDWNQQFIRDGAQLTTRRNTAFAVESAENVSGASVRIWSRDHLPQQQWVSE
ncbi:ricin-type beta-trefoil lectin domain protein [Thalassolituus sp. ST750PaO-4]|nr:ricin-type beta-trefoil lectin domain protein [Thalassolituus sp. ST750PaO-4]